MLCLHGKGGSGDEFAERLRPLRDALGPAVEFVFPTAPFPAGKAEGFAWWTLDDGARSFNATAYHGIGTTLARLDTLQREGAPFAAIVGHSQGAILAAVILATQANGQAAGAAGAEAAGAAGAAGAGSVGSSLRCAVLTGAAWPNPFAAAVEALGGQRSGDGGGGGGSGRGAGQDCSGSPRVPPTLHCIGENDAVNPPEQAERLAALCGGDVLRHGGGHVVPLGSVGCERIAAFVRRHLQVPS